MEQKMAFNIWIPPHVIEVVKEASRYACRGHVDLFFVFNDGEVVKTWVFHSSFVNERTCALVHTDSSDGSCGLDDISFTEVDVLLQGCVDAYYKVYNQFSDDWEIECLWEDDSDDTLS